MTDAITVAAIVSATATVAVAVTTIVYAVYTRQLVRENQLLRKAAKEPIVVVYLLPDNEILAIINFIVANVGLGPAYNVTICVHADDDDLRKHNVFLFDKWGKRPITILPQGEKIVTILGDLDLFEEPPLKPFRVYLSYEDISGGRYKSEHLLDPTEFLGISRIRSPQAEAAEALKNAANAVASAISRSHLSVEIISTQERERRDALFRKELERRRRIAADDNKA